MAAFSRSRGIFGAPLTADRGASPDAAPVTVDAAIPGYKKPSTLQTIAGVFGDTISELNGGQASFIPQLYAQRELQQKLALGQQQRANEFSDFTRRHDYEVDHPKAVNNDTVADYDFVLRTLGKEAADQSLRNRYDPMVNTTLPNNHFYSGPASKLGEALRGGSGAAVPQAPVGKLTPITGGPTPGASGGFRR